MNPTAVAGAVAELPVHDVALRGAYLRHATRPRAHWGEVRGQTLPAHVRHAPVVVERLERVGT